MHLLYDMVDVEIANNKVIVKSDNNINKVLPDMALWIFMDIYILTQILHHFSVLKHTLSLKTNMHEHDRL